MSRIFKCILNKVCKGIVKEPFRVKDVIDCLGTSTPFLSKHSIDLNDVNKKYMGNPYFIRVSRGLYKINPKYKTCP
jgi:hypothetical protein